MMTCASHIPGAGCIHQGMAHRIATLFVRVTDLISGLPLRQEEGAIRSIKRQYVCSLCIPQRIKTDEQPIAIQRQAKPLLQRVDKTGVCNGSSVRPSSTNYVSRNGELSSRSCTVISENSVTPCLHCKYLRKPAQKSVVSPEEVTHEKWAQYTARRLRAVKVKLARAQNTMAQMEAKNEKVLEQVFEDRIKSLPGKQQLAIRSCFQLTHKNIF